MLFQTAKWIAVTLLLSFVIGIIGVIFIKPIGTYTYFVGSKLTNPIIEEAREEAQNLNESGLTYSAEIMNAVTEEKEYHKTLWEAHQNNETFWMLMGIMTFIAAALFYTGWTEVKKG